MFSRLDTLILRVRDVGTARQWYAGALDLHPVYVDDAEGIVVLGMDGTSLTLWQLKPGESSAPGAAGTYPIFGIEDADAAHARLRDRGVKVEPVQDGLGVRFFSFYDPDGNRLEACQVLAG